jgi:hypothetical protein
MASGDLVFVDTPGFDDTHKSDVDILKMVADWLKSTYAFVCGFLTLLRLYFYRYEKDILLSGLLYFHRISDNRMAGTPLKNLRMFEELCGKKAFQHVILTTTMWDEVDEETGEARERELESKYWRAMLERNSTTRRFLRTRESAFELIFPLIDAADKRNSILLQDELVDMRKKLPSTSAGRELFSAMEVFVRQREDLLRRIRNEMKRTDSDKILLEPLQEEHQKLRTNLEETVNEMRRLKLPLGQRLLDMTDNFNSKFKSFKSMVFNLKRLSKAYHPPSSVDVQYLLNASTLGPKMSLEPQPKENPLQPNHQLSTDVKNSIDLPHQSKDSPTSSTLNPYTSVSQSLVSDSEDKPLQPDHQLDNDVKKSIDFTHQSEHSPTSSTLKSYTSVPQSPESESEENPLQPDYQSSTIVKNSIDPNHQRPASHSASHIPCTE